MLLAASLAGREDGRRCSSSRAAKAARRPAPLAAGEGATSRATHLRFASGTVLTLNRYRDAVEDFFAWARESNLAVDSDAAADLPIARFFDALASDAVQPSTGRCVLWGYLLLVPSAKRADPDRLLLSRKALIGWSRLMPGRSRHPVPLVIFFLIAQWCGLQGRLDAAVAIIVMVDSYARPSEIVNLKLSSVVRPSKSHRLWGLVIGNADLSERTKTGETDDTIILGTRSRTWIVQVFGGWVALRDAENNGDQFFPNLDLAGLRSSSEMRGLIWRCKRSLSHHMWPAIRAVPTTFCTG